MECPICVCESESFHECEYCEFKCCTDCQKSYMTSELVCMNCKYPVDLSKYKFDVGKFVCEKIKMEKAFMLTTRKQLALQVKKEAFLEEKNYFESLGCGYAHEFYTMEIAKLTLSDFGECIFCGEINFDNGEEIICECGLNQCSKCKQVKREDHICDDNLVLSENEVSQMRKCPCCGIPIFKIDGCYQILCTSCNCVFDYNTGRLDLGNIHSPAIYSMIAELEKESKVEPRNWKQENLYYYFDKISRLLVKTGKLSVNAKVREQFAQKKISESDFVKLTIKSYMKNYEVIREIKNLLKLELL